MIGIIVLTAVVCRFHDELPKAYRQRHCTGREWKRAFPSASKKDIRRFLAIFADAFAFRDRNRLKFSPEDKVMEIYKAIYPSTWMPDQLEHVQLVQGLEDEFKRAFPDELMTEGVTLGMIFEHMTGNANQASQPIAGKPGSG